jgi:hypothetical protein
MNARFPWELFLLLVLWLSQMISRAGIPVSEDGVQLAYVKDLHDLTVKIQGNQDLSQQHLAKIRALEEGGKAVALAMAQMDSLVKHGQLLNQNPEDQNQAVSANTLQYNGTNFVGGNYQFIDNLMGQNGPVALDRILPATLVPVSGGLLQQAQQSVTSFTQSLSPSLISATQDVLVGSLVPSGEGTAGQAVGQLLNQWMQGNGTNPTGMLGDGVFLRPYAGVVDDAYQTLVTNGTPLQKTQFFAADTLGGNGYNPIMGATGNPNLAMVNLDNVFSMGASQAYQTYQQNHATSGTNPYQGYANQLLSQLPALFSQTAPGMPLMPTSQQTMTAQQTPVGSTGLPGDYPPLFSADPVSQTGPVSSSPFGVSLPSADSTSQGVIVVTPPAAEAKAYQQRIADSDQRLQEIIQETKTQQQARQYLEQILQSLTSIQEQAQEIQKDLNQVEANSIPELTVMIRDLQGDLETRQQDLGGLSLGIEKLQQELHNELNHRALLVEQEQRQEVAHALPRWRAAMNGG